MDSSFHFPLFRNGPKNIWPNKLNNSNTLLLNKNYLHVGDFRKIKIIHFQSIVSRLIHPPPPSTQPFGDPEIPNHGSGSGRWYMRLDFLGGWDKFFGSFFLAVRRRGGGWDPAFETFLKNKPLAGGFSNKNVFPFSPQYGTAAGQDCKKT